MILDPLTDRAEIDHNFQLLAQTLRIGGQLTRLVVGFRGGGMELDIYWHPRQELWTATLVLENRYWCGFGTQEPVPLMGISCEINIPLEGINRRVAGVFGRDDGGRIHLTHSGKVGGGRPGIGKSALLAYYGNQPLATLTWHDGKRTSAIPIGQVSDPALLGKIADFVRFVERFKAQAAGDNS